MQLLFLDTETTGIDEGARLVQLAYKNSANGEVVSEYFCPPIPITFGAMATHHITNEMVREKPVFAGSEVCLRLTELLQSSVVVAHNAVFDVNILKNEEVEVPKALDTLQVARHLVVSEEHNLQYLRYFLGLNVEGAAHNALTDVLVLEKLFFHLKTVAGKKYPELSETEILEKMMELSTTPLLLSTFGFGKYKGKSFEEVFARDRGYIEWLYGSETQKKSSEQNENLVHTLEYYLQPTLF